MLNSIITYLGVKIAEQLAKLPLENLTELRLRVDKPVFAYVLGQEIEIAYRPSAADINETMERVSRYSLYAWEGN